MMNRRSFFKVLLGVASVAVIGLPKPTVSAMGEVNTIDVVSKNPCTSQACGRSVLHKTVRDLTHTQVSHRGFVYSYTHHAYATLNHRMIRLREVSGGMLGNCGHVRIFMADKIVRVRDGMVMKDRYGIEMRESGAPTSQDWDELYGRPVSLI